VSFRSIFDSDSENEGLVAIQNGPSYNLNQTKFSTFTCRNDVVAEVIGMSKGRYAVEKLDDLLLEVVDETMKQVFKEEGTKAIYNYLANNSHLKLEEIAEKPEVFSAGLERLLTSAAQVIEILILKSLHRRLGLQFEKKKGYEFSDYVKELRKSAVVKA